MASDFSTNALAYSQALTDLMHRYYAAVMSGQNFDGTDFSVNTSVPGGSNPAVVGPNILQGHQIIAATQAATTIITIPAGRVWVGQLAASCACDNAGANAVEAVATCLFTSANGTGTVTPAAGNLFSISATAGANVAAGTVGSQGDNYGAINATVTAVGGTALVQVTTTQAGTNSSVRATAYGLLQ
jgi:hypothetical protein